MMFGSGRRCLLLFAVLLVALAVADSALYDAFDLGEPFEPVIWQPKRGGDRGIMQQRLIKDHVDPKILNEVVEALVSALRDSRALGPATNRDRGYLKRSYYSQWRKSGKKKRGDINADDNVNEDDKEDAKENAGYGDNEKRGVQLGAYREWRKGKRFDAVRQWRKSK